MTEFKGFCSLLSLNLRLRRVYVMRIGIIEFDLVGISFECTNSSSTLTSALKVARGLRALTSGSTSFVRFGDLILDLDV